jgi:hypothetical protein
MFFQKLEAAALAVAVAALPSIDSSVPPPPATPALPAADSPPVEDPVKQDPKLKAKRSRSWSKVTTPTVDSKATAASSDESSSSTEDSSTGAEGDTEESMTSEEEAEKSKSAIKEKTKDTSAIVPTPLDSPA